VVGVTPEHRRHQDLDARAGELTGVEPPHHRQPITGLLARDEAPPAGPGGSCSAGRAPIQWETARAEVKDRNTLWT